jgi:hypothetical protein
MLLPQVPLKFQQQIAAELGVHVGVFSAKLSTKVNSLDNRVSRMEAVERHILAKQEVGTPEDPGSWIKGDDYAVMFQIKTSSEEDIFFCLIQCPTYLVGLGGSAIHIIGKQPKTFKDRNFGLSFLPDLMDGLNVATSEEFFASGDDVLKNIANASVAASSPWAKAIWTMTKERNDLPRQRITYLAKRLVTDNTYFQGQQVTLATPLFVALAD